MVMRAVFLITIFLLLSTALDAQNLIGMSAAKVKEYFSREEKAMVMDSSFKNEKYNYLKYVDEGTKLITKLVFFDSRGDCSFVRAIYDRSLESEVRKELDMKYRKESDSTWVDKNKKGNTRIDYIINDWFVSVEYKPYK